MYISEHVLHVVGKEVGMAIIGLLIIMMIPWEDLTRWFKRK